jgi:LPXTG-site transpeptidase (sortase) family protein
MRTLLSWIVFVISAIFFIASMHYSKIAPKVHAETQEVAVNTNVAPLMYAQNTELQNPSDSISKYSRLVIPKISVDSPVVIEGLESDGVMSVPKNFTEVGLYNAVMPGEIGNAVMGAHVDNGGSIPGVFKNLKNLSIGDDIYYYDKIGQKLSFKVKNIKIYNANEKDTSEVFTGSIYRGLNLITCYGKWLPKEKSYSSRIVIFSELI